MVRGAIETKVDTKRDRRPGWIFGAAVKTYLSTLSVGIGKLIMLWKMHTLFAGLVFSFSKIFCDWALVAELMVKAQRLYLLTKSFGG